MKNHIKIYLFLIILAGVGLNVRAQSQTPSVNDETSEKSKVQIAYGEQDENNVSSAISTVDGDDLLNGSITNFGNALYGKLPGLYVTQGGGEPGKDSPQLRIRGAVNEPLVIIDGFERNLDYIAPEEVESISLLKDATATALYGMRGADGVILITTKRGMVKKGTIDVSIQSGMQMFGNRADVLDAKQYMTMYNQAAVNDGLTPKYSDTDIASAGTSPRFPDVDWGDLILKDFSNVSKANLGLQGGSEFINYFVNLGFLYNNGMYKPENPDMNSNSNFTRMNIRSNIDINITKTTTFSMDLAGSINKSVTSAFSENQIWFPLNFYAPNAFNAVNPDGSYGGTNLFNDNPLAILEYGGRNNTLTHFLNAGFRLNQKLDFIAQGLSLNLGYVIDNGATNADGKWRFFQVKEIVPGTGEEYEYIETGENNPYGTWSNANSKRYTSFSGELKYDMPEINGHELNVFTRVQSDQQFLNNSDLSPYLTNNIGARIMYSKDKKYLLELAASYFGSDQYASGKQYGFFPSASVGWVFSNENFLSQNDVLSYGKLRASYGMVGRNRYENGRYPFVQFYNSNGNYPLGTEWDNASRIEPDRLANPDVTWEMSTQMNIGVELEMFKQFSFTADYFMNKNSNVLYGDDRNYSFTGATRPWENIGESTISGFDMKLGYSSTEDDFKWHANLLLSYFTHTIDQRGEALYSGELSYLNKSGNSPTAIWGLETDGVFAGEDELASAINYTTGVPRVGDFKYVDQNNDEVIDWQDRVVVGDYRANIEFGVQLGFEYKNFDLSMLLQGQLNHDINLMSTPQTAPFVYGNSATEIALQDDFPPLTLSSMHNYKNSDYWVRNGDFLKMRNLEIGYTLSESASRFMGMNNVRFFARGVNVLTLSKYKFSDPEYTEIGYPPMKSYLLGLNINF